MSGRKNDPDARASRWIHVVSRMVPRAAREEWVREWGGEWSAGRTRGRTWPRLLLWALEDAARERLTSWSDSAVGSGLAASALRQTLRTLRRSPGYATAVVLTLGLGVGANTAVYSVVNAVLLRPLPLQDADRVVRVGDLGARFGGATSAPNFRDWKSENRSFEDLVAIQRVGATLTGLDIPMRVSRSLVTEGAFELLGVPMAMGAGFPKTADGPVREDLLILSHEFWTAALGADPSAVGRTVNVNGEPHTVVGVLTQDFRIPPFTAQVYAPLVFTPDALDARGRNNVFAVGRLRADVTVIDAERDMNRIRADLAEAYPNAGLPEHLDVRPLQDAAVEGRSRALWILLACAGFVLLVASVNVAGLVAARGSGRAREMAVRYSLGASRGQLALHLLLETLVLALIGGALGLVLAWAGVGPLARLVPGGLTGADRITLDGGVLAVAATAAVLSGLIAGLAPALRVGRHAAARGRAGAAGALRTRGGALPGARWLVPVQFALTAVLLVGAGLLSRSLAALYDVDLGFRTESLSTFSLTFKGGRYADPPNVIRAVDAVVLGLRAQPGNEGAAAISHLPLSGSALTSSLLYEGGPLEPAPDPPSASIRVTTPDYFAVSGIDVMAGRGFTDADGPTSDPVMMVSPEVAERLWPGEDPLGRWASWANDATGDPIRRRVVGVTASARTEGPDRAPAMLVYQPQAQTTEVWRWFGGTMSFVTADRSGAPLTAAAVRSIVSGIDPDLPVVGFGPYENVLASRLATPRFNGVLIGLFASLALVLSAVGLYGVTSFAVRQRRRELGVRVALGAGRDRVVSHVLGGALRNAAVGLGAGLIIAFLLAGTVSSLVWGIQPRDALTYAGTAGTLLLVAALAAAVPAWRASRVDPVEALTAE